MARIVKVKFLFVATFIINFLASCTTYDLTCKHDNCVDTFDPESKRVLYYKRNIIDNSEEKNTDEDYKLYDTSNYKRSYIKSTETEEDNPNRNKAPVVKSYITHDKSKTVINDPETIEDFTNIKIDSAREACLDLGLKENTEKLGESVLQLIE